MLHLHAPPSAHHSRLRHTALLALLGVTVLWVAACQPAIQVLPPQPEPLAIATVMPSSHALAIVGIDFDPPLQYEQIMAAGGVSLITAIQNQGQHAESNVSLTAQLYDPAARGKPTPLLNETVVIETLEPGDVRLVRFGQVTALPLRGRYKLVVQVSTVPGETDHSDNARIYEIVVSDAR